MGWWQCSKIDCGNDCITLTMPKAPELYTLNRWITWCVNKAVIKNTYEASLSRVLTKIKKPVIIKKDDLIANFAITNTVQRLTCNYSPASVYYVKKKILSLLTLVKGEVFCGEFWVISSPGLNVTAVLVLGVGRELKNAHQLTLFRFQKLYPLFSMSGKNTSHEKH